MHSKLATGMAALVLVSGCGGGGDDGGGGGNSFGGQYTVKTALTTTNCSRISPGQGNTHVATITKSGDSVTITDGSGLHLSGTLTGSNLTATGATNVDVTPFCQTSNTLSLTATVPNNSTIQGTVHIQMTYPSGCQRLSNRTCAADLKYEAVKEGAAAPASTIPSGTLLWANPTRLGNTGTYPAVEFDSTGKGHALYRRDHNVYYRNFNGTTWGNEIRVNDDGSQTEQEIKDRNLPKIAIDSQNRAWLLWGGDLPTLNIYLRSADANGSLVTPIKLVQITDVIPNMGRSGNKAAEQPEETALSFSKIDNRLHVTAVYIGDSDLIPYDQRRDGVYDMVVDPATQAIERASKLGLASKNLYTISGPQKVHGFFRLNSAVYFRYDGGTDYAKIQPISPPYLGNLGALNPWTSDDAVVHLTAMSTYPVPTYIKRQVVYSRFNPTSSGGALLESVVIEKEFASPIGIAPLIVLPTSNNVFVTYDRHNPELTGNISNTNSTIQEVAFAWRLGTAAAGSAFTGGSAPFLWPGRTISFGQEPAIALSNNTVHAVWDNKTSGTFDATAGTFQP